jgi:acyl-coenzyme A thioesterase 13
MAISAATNSAHSGVSVDLNVSYLKAIKVGETIDIVGKCDKVGKTLGFTTIDLFVKNENGEKMLAATGRHTKFIK